MLLFLELAGPIHNLASPQLGPGFGLTFVCNGAFVSSYSGIRFLAPAKPLLILDSSIQQPEPTSPELVRSCQSWAISRGILFHTGNWAPVMAVLEAKQDGRQAALADVAGDF
jgi:hypothetical protein